IWNQSAGSRHTKSLIFILLAPASDCASMERLRHIALIRSKLFRLRCVHERQWKPSGLRIFGPFGRIDIAEIHNPQISLEIHHILRHRDAVDEHNVELRMEKTFSDSFMQPGRPEIICGTGHPRWECLQSLQPPCGFREDLCDHLVTIIFQSGSFVEFLLRMGQTCDNHGMFPSEMADHVKRSNLSSPIWGKGETMSDKEYSHCASAPAITSRTSW